MEIKGSYDSLIGNLPDIESGFPNNNFFSCKEEINKKDEYCGDTDRNKCLRYSFCWNICFHVLLNIYSRILICIYKIINSFVKQ